MIAVSWLILSPSRFQVLSTPATRPPLNLNLMPGLNLGNTIFTLHLSLCSMCSCTLYYMSDVDRPWLRSSMHGPLTEGIDARHVASMDIHDHVAKKHVSCHPQL